MKKKIVAIVLALALTGSLAACGSSNEETAQTTAETTSKAEETEVTEETEQEEPAKEEVKEEEAPVEETEMGNMIDNPDFANGVGKWSTYFNGGTGVLNVNEEGQLAVNIIDTGDLDYSVQAFYDGFKLETGVVYKFSFDVAASTPRTVVWRIQVNGGDYHPYFTETIAATTEMQHVEYELTMEEGSDPAPRLCFNLGSYEGDGDLGEHTVMLDNFDLSVLDASNKVVADDAIDTPDINLNQVGYQTTDVKKATFRGESVGTEFEVINVADNSSVFTGQIAGEAKNKASQENCGVGDFTSVTAPGTYKVTSKECGESYEFTISDDVYKDLMADSIRMLYLQRCGVELSTNLAGDFAHGVCHTGEATIYGTGDKKEVSGGWHDAGDYGRYVVSGAKAVADLLLAYEDNTQLFTDDLNIPESGNGTADILDEVRYELDWMLKMQDETSGGVYHKVTCANFPETVMPQDETEELILSPISNTATGDFAAVMAMAGRTYKSVDAAFADTCLEASKKALSYIEANVDAEGFKNPEDIVTGEYPDDKSTDEHFWALAELYKTTGDSSYEDKLKEFKILGTPGGLGWDKVGFYGMYTYMTCENIDADIAAQIKDKFDYALEGMITNMSEDAYESTLGDTYPWGSNMSVANNGMMFLMAQRMAEKTGDSKAAEYLTDAQSQLSYLLGHNATSYCFVTGYGSLSPMNTHHRPSQVLGKSMKGMLVGGPDNALEDPFAKATLTGVAAAKCYADNAQSYSCNEVTIYWNSPLIYLLSGIMGSK